MAKRIGVVLSGCGVLDGTEIHEAVLTLLALDRAGAEAVCLAPNTRQLHVVNHLTGAEDPGEVRNILTESARIARGKVHDIGSVKTGELDAVIVPGGFGVAKNLCDYAIKGPDCTVQPDVARLIQTVHAAGKPVGFICIAPVLAAKILGTERPELTIGTDEKTARDLEQMGARHVACSVTECRVDLDRKVVSTPAYMLGKRISDVAAGIDQLVRAVLALT